MEGVMKADAFDIQLDELDHACLDLTEMLEGLRMAIVHIRHLREQGRPVSEIVASGPGVPARREVRESWSGLNRALHVYRVRLVKSMVDDEGMSIADAARVMRNARQVVSRLYHGA
jgi:hypothetical protein